MNGSFLGARFLLTTSRQPAANEDICEEVLIAIVSFENSFIYLNDSTCGQSEQSEYLSPNQKLLKFHVRFEQKLDKASYFKNFDETTNCNVFMTFLKKAGLTYDKSICAN